MILSQKEKIRADYESYIDYAEERGMARGIEQGMAQGIEQGMARGIEQGMAQGIYIIIKNAIISGFDDKTILLIANISKEKLEEIKKEIK